MTVPAADRSDCAVDVMEICRELTTPCDAERLFAWVEDLDHYPEWMSLVHSIQRLDSHGSTSAPLAWNVELRAQVGPFARSKVLRMERSEHSAPGPGPDFAAGRATFERRELDGRAHSAWTLRATVVPGPTTAASHLSMELQYGGSLWGGPILQRVLDDAIGRASEKLVDVVSAAPAPPDQSRH